ncbi:hypothetical protein PMIN02_013153 [Paraphaeosphaeria minitans]
MDSGAIDEGQGERLRLQMAREAGLGQRVQAGDGLVAEIEIGNVVPEDSQGVASTGGSATAAACGSRRCGRAIMGLRRIRDLVLGRGGPLDRDRDRGRRRERAAARGAAGGRCGGDVHGRRGWQVGWLAGLLACWLVSQGGRSQIMHVYACGPPAWRRAQERTLRCSGTAGAEARALGCRSASCCVSRS